MGHEEGFFSGLEKKAVPPGVRGASRARAAAGLIAVGICMVVLACLHCATTPSVISEGGVVTVTAEDNGATVEMAVGDILQIELMWTPSTVYRWRFDVLDEAYLELIEEGIRQISTEKLEGAPVLSVWRLRAEQAGETLIRMAYDRPWEGGDKPVKWFWVNVRIRPHGR